MGAVSRRKKPVGCTDKWVTDVLSLVNAGGVRVHQHTEFALYYMGSQCWCDVVKRPSPTINTCAVTE